jgi:preprotein translocase subunit SecG
VVTAIIVVHAIVCIGLIMAILLHSGRGTGLSSMLSGGMSSIGGTSVIEKNLDRITIGLAMTFVVTTIVLVIKM